MAKGGYSKTYKGRNVTFVTDGAGFVELLGRAAGLCTEAAGNIQQQVSSDGLEYTVESGSTGQRPYARVKPGSVHAYNHEMKYGTLAKVAKV